LVGRNLSSPVSGPNFDGTASHNVGSYKIDLTGKVFKVGDFLEDTSSSRGTDRFCFIECPRGLSALLGLPAI